MAQNEHAADAAQNASDEVASQGPPTELPDAVPDFVGEIHSTINAFVGGGAESIGESVSGIASNAMAGEVAAVGVDAALVLPL